MTTKEPMAYIATKPCGCIVAAVLVGAMPTKALAKQIALWVEAEYNVEFVTFNYTTENWDLCDHGHKQQALSEDAVRAAERAVQRFNEQNGDGGLTYTVAEDGTVGSVEIEGETPDQQTTELRHCAIKALENGCGLVSPLVEQEGEFPHYHRAHTEFTPEAVIYVLTKAERTLIGNGEYLDTFDVDAAEEFIGDYEAFLVALEAIAPLEQWEVYEEFGMETLVTPLPEYMDRADEENQVLEESTPTDHDDLVMTEALSEEPAN